MVHGKPLRNFRGPVFPFESLGDGLISAPHAHGHDMWTRIASNPNVFYRQRACVCVRVWQIQRERLIDTF